MLLFVVNNALSYIQLVHRQATLTQRNKYTN